MKPGVQENRTAIVGGIKSNWGGADCLNYYEVLCNKSEEGSRVLGQNKSLG